MFLPTLTFFVFFLFHADMSTSNWWAKRWWFLPPPNKSYSLLLIVLPWRAIKKKDVVVI